MRNLVFTSKKVQGTGLGKDAFLSNKIWHSHFPTCSKFSTTNSPQTASNITSSTSISQTASRQPTELIAKQPSLLCSIPGQWMPCFKSCMIFVMTPAHLTLQPKFSIWKLKTGPRQLLAALHRLDLIACSFLLLPTYSLSSLFCESPCRHWMPRLGGSRHAAGNLSWNAAWFSRLRFHPAKAGEPRTSFAGHNTAHPGVRSLSLRASTSICMRRVFTCAGTSAWKSCALHRYFGKANFCQSVHVHMSSVPPKVLRPMDCSYFRQWPRKSVFINSIPNYIPYVLQYPFRGKLSRHSDESSGELRRFLSRHCQLNPVCFQNPALWNIAARHLAAIFFDAVPRRRKLKHRLGSFQQ